MEHADAFHSATPTTELLVNNSGKKDRQLRVKSTADTESYFTIYAQYLRRRPPERSHILRNETLNMVF